mgnify:CR=1 FL=1
MKKSFWIKHGYIDIAKALALLSAVVQITEITEIFEFGDIVSVEQVFRSFDAVFH